MTMLTTRNKLTATLMPHDTPMLDEIDAVYEILDAELPSPKSVSDQGMSIIKGNHNPTVKLSELFLRHVYEVSKRDGLMLGAPAENFTAIADRLAQDWDNCYGADYRREQQSASSPSL